MSITLKIIICGLLFLSAIISGICLTRLGKPLNPIIFNIHKLIALSSAIFIAILTYSLFSPIEIKPAALALSIITGLLILVLFISGALLSTGKLVNKTLLIVHNAGTFLALISNGAIIYLLVRG
jgi:hypothetical protein